MSLEANGELVPVGGGDPIPLVRDSLTIGRRESCDIPLRFPNVSGIHCQLNFHDGYWYVRDMNSTNGVKVNGERVQKKMLRPGDELSIAKRRFTVQYTPPLAGKRALEEMEEDILSQSLLERAGLERPKEVREAKAKGAGKGFDPADFLLGGDEEEG